MHFKDQPQLSLNVYVCEVYFDLNINQSYKFSSKTVEDIDRQICHALIYEFNYCFTSEKDISFVSSKIPE